MSIMSIKLNKKENILGMLIGNSIPQLEIESYHFIVYMRVGNTWALSKSIKLDEDLRFVC